MVPVLHKYSYYLVPWYLVVVTLPGRYGSSSIVIAPAAVSLPNTVNVLPGSGTKPGTVQGRLVVIPY